MRTLLLSVSAVAPEAAVVARAAAVLRRGGLVAFPTETVYGLGANAIDAEAVSRILQAKGRPPTNPLIVHVHDAEAARALVTAWPDDAERLAARFWPGPLTLVLPRARQVPDIVSAGGPTVAVRVPAHPVALALLRATELPLAAPSANRSTSLSPTRAEHVLRGLDGRIDMVLDAGPTPGGLESTVLDLTVLPARILRPGLVSAADLQAILGSVLSPSAWAITSTDRGQPAQTSAPARSPGLIGRHYAPATPVECSTDDGAGRVRTLLAQGMRVGWLPLSSNETPPDPPDAALITVPMPDVPEQYAARLYDVLHRLDELRLDRIVVASPPAAPDWLAVHDRLRRMTMK